MDCNQEFICQEREVEEFAKQKHENNNKSGTREMRLDMKALPSSGFLELTSMRLGVPKLSNGWVTCPFPSVLSVPSLPQKGRLKSPPPHFPDAKAEVLQPSEKLVGKTRGQAAESASEGLRHTQEQQTPIAGGRAHFLH